MNRRRFLSCALIPLVPAQAVAAAPRRRALDTLLRRFLEVTLAHFEATGNLDIVDHILPDRAYRIMLADAPRLKGLIDGGLNYRIGLK